MRRQTARNRYRSRSVGCGPVAWLLLLVLACGTTWYVTKHGLPRGRSEEGPSAVEPRAAPTTKTARTPVPTLDDVASLRTHSRKLKAEVRRYVKALSDHQIRAGDAHRKRRAVDDQVPFLRVEPAWEREMSRIFLRLAESSRHPGWVPLDQAEDALMRSDDEAATHAYRRAQEAVRTAEGYVERIREIAAAHGLQPAGP